MRNATLVALVILLTGCAAGHGSITAPDDLRLAATTPLQFYNDADLRERTVAACSADNEAEYQSNMAMTGCKNVAAAQLAIDSGRGAPR